jgi:serine/threonine-protein kinase
LGNYRIVSTIGEGGMGVVYRAEHVLIGRKVAVKLLQPRMSHDAELVDRFFTEARAAAMIQHPGLVELFDFGYHEDGRAYIVMELVEGESLTARLARDGRLPLDLALVIARQMASALHAAHEQGIVHRDLKPENIFLVPDAESPVKLRVKVLDFGIAKLLGVEEERSVKTKTGAVFGTPRYMSPEQCKNATNVDRRTDIYALGCIIYEMVLGTPPFDYDSWGELVAAHIHETPRRPREVDRELPADIELIILRATAKQPADRFATMADLAQATEACLRTALTSEFPIARLTPLPGHKVAQVAPTLPVAAELTVPPWPGRQRRWPLVLAIAGVTGAALIVVIVASDREEPQHVAEVQPPSAPSDAAAVESRPDAAVVVTLAADAPPATRVHLVVDSVPSGAEVYRALDGVRLGKTRLERDFERTEGEVELVLKLAGFRDARVTLSTAIDGKSMTKLSRPIQIKPPAKGSAGSANPGETVLDPYGGGK